MRLGFFLIGLLIPAAAYAAPLPWSYGDSDTGEDDWGTLAKEYAACEIGTQQSPIRMSYAKLADLSPLAPDYSPSKASIALEEYALRIHVSGNNSLTDHGIRYALKYITLHTPAEHIANKQQQPVELEMLHQSSDGKMLILSVTAKLGAENPQLAQLLAHIHNGAIDSTESAFNPALLLPQKRVYYAYTGSLTAPPCTEGVKWRIFKEPIEISELQLKTITRVISRNARLPQPIYMRQVLESKE